MQQKIHLVYAALALACSSNTNDSDEHLMVSSQESSLEQAQRKSLRSMVLQHLELSHRAGGIARSAEAISLARLKTAAAASEVVELYLEAEGMTETANLRAELTILLGLLEDKRAIDLLVQIVERPLPDHRKAPDDYDNEYLNQVLAVSALGNLGAIEKLNTLYNEGGKLRAVAAVALAEQGAPPPGVREVDRSVALGEPDPADERTLSRSRTSHPIPAGAADTEK